MKQLTWSRMAAGVLATAVLLAGFILLAPTSLGGTASWVVTTGNSMAPRITTGDLVIVRTSSSYRVGDVVAYASAELDQTVLHRVVSIEGDHYTFRGDHNDFDDPEQPTRQQFIGAELLHIPSGGIWLDRITSPTALGVLAFALLAGGGTAAQTRHRRKRRAMSQHAAPTRSSRWLTGRAAWLRTTAALAALAGAVGLALGAVSWTRPTTTFQTVTDRPTPAMTFSYHAEVPRTPAYDGTRVTSPAPIFRTLTNQVDLRYSYRGDPGTVSLAAELSTASGWRSTVPLQRPVPIDDAQAGSAPLDLNQLQARAEAAAAVIGIPTDLVDVTVVATIKTADGHIFAPSVALALTPTQLTVPGGTPTMTVSDTKPPESQTRIGHTLGIAGYQVPVTTLRTASITLALAGLLILGVVGFAITRTASNEAAVIRRRYAAMLLRVEPVTSPPGRPVVDVVDFRALARLAERHGLLVMHWTRSGVETFIVHDDGITYRYRTGTGATRPAPGAGTPRSADDQVTVSPA